MATWTVRPSWRRSSLALAVIAMAAVMLSTMLAAPASAHGSVADPASRLYACMHDEDARNNNEMCIQAWEQNPTALYNWMALLIGDAGGQSESIIPDGRLCSADNDGYAAFDEPGAWPATEVDNTFTVTWDSSPGPHKATYYSYVTRQGFDPLTDPLTWDDLEEVGFADGFDVEGPESAANSYEVSAPGRTGRHILFTVWQRPDTAEAFYACSDVIFPGGDAAADDAPADEAADEDVAAEEQPVDDAGSDDADGVDAGGADAAAGDAGDDAATDDTADGSATDDAADAAAGDGAAEEPAGDAESAPEESGFDLEGIRGLLLALLQMFGGLFG